MKAQNTEAGERKKQAFSQTGLTFLLMMCALVAHWGITNQSSAFSLFRPSENLNSLYKNGDLA